MPRRSKNQALQILLAQLSQRIAKLIIGVFVEFVDVDVGDAGPNHERVVDAILGNLIPDNAHLDGLLIAFAKDRNVNLRALGALQHFRDLRGIQPIGGFAIDFRHNVAGPQSSAKGRRTRDRRHHHGDELAHLAGARLDRHAHAVVLPLLIFTKQGEGARVKEI